MMDRRSLLRAALGAAAASPLGAALGTAATAQTPAGVAGVDYFPIYFSWFRSARSWRLNADYHSGYGLYQSDDSAVVAAQMTSLAAHGGRGFAVNWFGRGNFPHDAFVGTFLPALAGQPGLEFCLQYDPFIRWGLPLPKFATDDGAAEQWRSDMRYIARSLMPQPQYARVDGRPLLFVYVTRAIEAYSDLEAFVDIARQEAAAAGHAGVFLVLGEVWWIPTDEGAAKLETTLANRARRARLADGVYSYNLTTPPENNRIWRSNVRTFLGETARVYKGYRNLMDDRGAPGVKVITTLMPRFDNRRVRAEQGNPNTAEIIDPWQGFYGIDYQADMEVGLSKLSPAFEPVRGDRTVVVVQAWNEWGERTAIEGTPVGGSDRYGLPLPGDAYVRGMGTAVGKVLAPRDPRLRPEVAPHDTSEALEAILLRLQMSTMRSRPGEHLGPDHVSAGRRLYRATWGGQ